MEQRREDAAGQPSAGSGSHSSRGEEESRVPSNREIFLVFLCFSVLYTSVQYDAEQSVQYCSNSGKMSYLKKDLIGHMEQQGPVVLEDPHSAANSRKRRACVKVRNSHAHSAALCQEQYY